MTFLHRLRLRDNWPLWVAGVSFLLTVVAWLFQDVVNKNVCYPSSNQSIDYWWTILQCNGSLNAVTLLLVLGCFSVLMLLDLIARAILHRPTQTSLIAILTMIIMNVWGLTLCVGSIYWTGKLLIHVSTVNFENHQYHLMREESYGGGIGSPDKYHVYECDSSGTTCTLKESFLQNGIPTPYPANLIVDSRTQKLVIEIKNERGVVIIRDIVG